MSHEIVQYEAPAGEMGRAAPPAAPPSPIAIAHGLLRGRYVWAVALAVLFAPIGAVVGYNALQPKYTSTGVISIAPTRPVILFQNELNQPLPAFDSFVQEQASIIQSSRVRDGAVATPLLRDAGWPAPPEGARVLQAALEVKLPRHGREITVAVTHADPELAKAAVDAVLLVYEGINSERATTEIDEREQGVREQRDKFERDYKQAMEAIRRLAEEQGSLDLERLEKRTYDQIERYEQQVFALEAQLAALTLDAPDGDAPAVQRIDGAIIDTLAATDAELDALLGQRLNHRLELGRLSATVGPAHRQYKATAAQLRGVEEHIQARAEQLLGRAEDLRARLEHFKTLLSTATARASELGQAKLNIAEEREKASRAQQLYEMALKRLDELQIEKGSGKEAELGRITVRQRADTPLGPSTDRRLPLAVAGAGAGAGAGVALVAGVGLLFRKIRYFSDLPADDLEFSVLGAIPAFDPRDPASMEAAAEGIHLLRNVLEVREGSRRDRGAVYAVTSAVSAEGKSTLSMALAESFAASGRSTILVDADLIGRQLSSQLGMLDGEGFAEAARAGAVNGSVRDAPAAGIAFLPAGDATSGDPDELSPSRVRRVVDELRTRYDTVIIDTGPILGSIEASALPAVADSVILVVSRGLEQRLVKSAAQRLRHVHARRIGMVFNRASPGDFSRSISTGSSSVRAASSRRSAARDRAGVVRLIGGAVDGSASRSDAVDTAANGTPG